MNPALRARPLLLAALAVALAAGSGPAVAGPSLQLKPCRVRGVEYPAQCGVLRRPLDPGAPAGAQIELHLAVLPALSRNKRPDPVFFFAGGPGQSAIDLAGTVARLLGRFSNRRDLVLIDQRGSGRSAPLVCDGERGAQRSLRESTDPDRQVQALAQCRQELQRLPHGDLRHYTTSTAMQDAEAVRQALGAERINLVGVSYGTRAALEYLRQFPHATRRVVLDGVTPPDMALPAAAPIDSQAAFDALLAWCRDDASCRSRHPQLASQWAALLATLPREVTLQHPLSGRDETLVLTPDMLTALVRGPLYLPLLASALPLAIEAAAQSRWSPLAGLAWAVNGPARGLAQGQHFSVICAEDQPRAGSPGTAAGFGGGLVRLYAQVCADWPRGDVPAAFYQVPPAPVPVLLLSGGLDPVTPPRHGQRVAQALGAKARHVIVPQAGHGLLGQGCVGERVFRFVDHDDESAALALDMRCAQGLPRPPLFSQELR